MDSNRFSRVRNVVASIPVVNTIARFIYRKLAKSGGRPYSPSYWETRYRKGGNSGAGSYGRLARFKAEVLNEFVAVHHVQSVIEFGCGDGAQLLLASYPDYIGVDISNAAVDLCSKKFADDESKRFIHTDAFKQKPFSAELALSLDVIYHLLEDTIFDAYMRQVTFAGKRFLGIYSSNFDGPGPAAHVRHHKFTDWIAQNTPEWQLLSHVKNIYPEDPANPGETSWADFYFFSRAHNG